MVPQSKLLLQNRCLLSTHIRAAILRKLRLLLFDVKVLASRFATKRPLTLPGLILRVIASAEMSHSSLLVLFLLENQSAIINLSKYDRTVMAKGSIHLSEA